MTKSFQEYLGERVVKSSPQSIMLSNGSAILAIALNLTGKGGTVSVSGKTSDGKSDAITYNFDVKDFEGLKDFFVKQ